MFAEQIPNVSKMRMSHYEAFKKLMFLWIYSTTTLIEDELNNKHYVDVESIILHPKFSNQTNHNDIALVRLKEEQVEIKPICLPFEGTPKL